MQEKRPHKANLANKTLKKKQCIRCQIFWLTYQNYKKKHQIGIARAKNNQKPKQMQRK